MNEKSGFNLVMMQHRANVGIQPVAVVKLANTGLKEVC